MGSPGRPPRGAEFPGLSAGTLHTSRPSRTKRDHRELAAVLLRYRPAQVVATTACVLAQRWFGSTGVSLAAGVVTIVLFVYGEAIPKTPALRHPLPVATVLARPLKLLSPALRPVVSVLVSIADVQSAAGGRIEESDAELIEKSFDLGDMRVR